jgi:hypothetical protein
MAIVGSQFVVSVGSPSNAPGNEAQVGFAFLDKFVAGYQQAAMYCAAFIAGCGQLEGDSYIANVSFRNTDMTGSLDVPWDAGTWATIHTDHSYVPELDGYGDTFGTDGPIASGLGITLLENTAYAGRSYTGRMYIPCISSAAIQSNGRYASATATVVSARYKDLIIDDIDTIFDTVPVVRSKTLNTQTPIISSTMMLTPCRLRSRQR